jgi:N-acetyl-anhydromuramyl-L-alanine amidase AmpD
MSKDYACQYTLSIHPDQKGETVALYPPAIKKLIPAGSNDPRIIPRVAILHVADMLGPSLWDYFAHRSGGIESHFYIRLDGTVEQYRDTGYQADANYLANDFAVSIETEGRAAGEWTQAQVTAIQRLLLWLNTTDKIPLRKIQAWDGAGVGYHTLFGAPSKWTPCRSRVLVRTGRSSSNVSSSPGSTATPTPPHL